MAFDDNIKDLFTRDELMKIGIYDLRKLGQDVGVVCPTALKKEELVDKILAVIYGEAPVRRIGKGRGRPPKNNDKPSKLYLELVESVEKPNIDSEFVLQDERYFNTSGVMKVASPRTEYINNDDESSINTLKKGVVAEENGKFFARKLRYVASENDFLIPNELVRDYDLKDCDLIEFLLNDDGKSVSQVLKINGSLASRCGNFKIRDASRLITIGSEIEIRTNESNIIYAKTPKERGEIVEIVAKKLGEEGYKVVKVNFDKFELEKDDGNSPIVNLYCVGARDEYETMATIEAGIQRAKVLASLENKCVLLIDNLGWLISVVETYPKYLYGSFIEKLSKLASDKYLNLTVVCIMSDVTKEDANRLAGIFDNFNLNHPL